MEISHRRLPHIYGAEQQLFVTFRLYGSLPVGRQFPKDDLTSGEAFVAMDRLLDSAQYGSIYLKRSGIAGLVRDSIRYCGRRDCDLHAWVIMVNHVRLLFTPHVDVSQLLRRLKGFSARRIGSSEKLGNHFGKMKATTIWCAVGKSFAGSKGTSSIIQ
jgi:hypothetical protein